MSSVFEEFEVSEETLEALPRAAELRDLNFEETAEIIQAIIRMARGAARQNQSELPSLLEPEAQQQLNLMRGIIEDIGRFHLAQENPLPPISETPQVRSAKFPS